MKTRICQSCSMPMDDSKLFGTNADGSVNEDYCVYCFKEGKFTDGINDLNDYIQFSLQFSKDAGMSEEQMKSHCERVLPTLKRWKK